MTMQALDVRIRRAGVVHPDSTEKTNATAKALYEARGWKLDTDFDQYERFF
jgi:hypothetical protein